MGIERDLTERAAIEKIQHIAKDQVAMLCTTDAAGKLVTRPMATQSVDDDGTLWFMSQHDSNKIRELNADARIQLLYAVHGRSEYLQVYGIATINRDQVKIDELWTPIAKNWFPEGKDDPNICLIAVTPNSGYYWDTQHGKMATLVGMAVGALTGKAMDDGVEGKITV